MENLTLHIEYLLLHHDCVVVPGFGAFIAVRGAARYDEERQIFMPMTREIRFNELLRDDDGLLASSFARRAGVSYAEGRMMMLREISSLSDTLRNQGTVAIGRLGALDTSADGRLCFHPFGTPEADAAAMGFYPVIRRKTVATHEKGLTASAPGQDVAARAAKSARYYYFRISKKAFRAAAAFFTAAIVSLAFLMPSSQDTMPQRAATPVKVISEAISSAPAKASASVPGSTDIASIVNPSDWHLIVGTFRTQEEADSFIEAKKDAGYTLTKVASSRLVRVSAADASDKEELLALQRTPEFKKAFAEAWIYHDHN